MTQNCIKRGISIVFVMTSLYYLYTAWVGLFSPFKQLVPLLGVCLVAIFLEVHPLRKDRRTWWSWGLDVLLSVLSAYAAYYCIANEVMFGEVASVRTTEQLAVACILCILVLEGTRRTMGLVLPVLSLAFVLYSLFGNYIPGAFHHAGFSWQRIVDYIALTEFGIFGVPMSAATNIIIYFLIFAAFLELSGGGQYFIDMASSVMGRFRGGPAKIAVAASGLLGTITGSVVANVTTTGAFTIPMMKRTGYKPHVAGAIEALASTGGQFMPPIMGAAAFIMANIMGIPYWSVVVAAAIPAILYYVAIFIAVDLEAAKQGLKGLPKSEVPSFWKTFPQGYAVIIPIAVLIYWIGIIQGSPRLAAIYSLIAMLILAAISSRTRIGPRKFYQGLEKGTRAAVMVTMACACCGFIIAVTSVTGLGLILAGALVDLAGGNLPLLLVLAMFCSILLGMGMPTSACYIFLAILVAPAITQLGVPKIASHLFVLYFGCLSQITPPVGVGFFAAAPLADAPPFKIGFTAMRMGLIAWLLPFMFVLNPALILQGTFIEIVLSTITALLGVAGFGIMLQDYFACKLASWERVLFGIGGLCLVAPVLVADIAGIALIILGAILNIRKRQRQALIPTHKRST